jgi:cutinase
VIIGPALCNGLKKKYDSKFACQGVGTDDGYPAAVGDNGKPKGTCDTCITGAVKTFEKVHAKCPNAKLLFMGYSQGGALMSSVIPQLPNEVKAKVIGGVVFGSTRGTIAGIPKESWAAYCATDDRICNSRGNTGSTGSHLSYSSNGDADKAIAFLSTRIDGAGRAAA